MEWEGRAARDARLSILVHSGPRALEILDVQGFATFSAVRFSPLSFFQWLRRDTEALYSGGVLYIGPRPPRSRVVSIGSHDTAHTCRKYINLHVDHGSVASASHVDMNGFDSGDAVEILLRGTGELN